MKWIVRKKDQARILRHEDDEYVIIKKGKEHRVRINGSKTSAFRNNSLELCKQFCEGRVNDAVAARESQLQGKRDHAAMEKYLFLAEKYGRDWHFTFDPKIKAARLKEAGLKLEEITDKVVRLADVEIDRRAKEKCRAANLDPFRMFDTKLNGSLCLEPGDVQPPINSVAARLRPFLSEKWINVQGIIDAWDLANKLKGTLDKLVEEGLLSRRTGKDGKKQYKLKEKEQ